MREARNVFEAILKYGHDEDFVPHQTEEFGCTEAPAGSPAVLKLCKPAHGRGRKLSQRL